MSRRRKVHLAILGLTLCMYGYLAVVYVLRGQLSIWTLPVILLGLYVADAASGVAHFVVDYTPNVGGIGLKELFEYPGNKGSDDYVKKRDIAMRKINGFQEVVFDFKVHHLTPGALGNRSILKMTLPVVVFGSFPLTVLILLLGELRWLHPDLSLFLLVLIGAGTISQYAHACTHKKQVPVLVRGLQACRLFLNPTAHNTHHETPHKHFCLLNGWANPLINRVFQVLQARGYFHPDGLRVV